ncbi:hypothetical protein ANN_07857 [Periplaneta americana]|uniref:Uncharacterized protein n=1 Tax=Periplaneta americana TaxID=6978 RepID=A0ABQ8T0Y6_PERAM|nr:hypothetical protein ANN_07857 [Periplaneta americana]
MDVKCVNKFKVCHGSLYVMWLVDEPREFNLPTLPQRRITYVTEKLPVKYGIHSEEADKCIKLRAVKEKDFHTRFYVTYGTFVHAMCLANPKPSQQQRCHGNLLTSRTGGGSAGIDNYRLQIYNMADRATPTNEAEKRSGGRRIGIDSVDVPKDSRMRRSLNKRIRIVSLVSQHVDAKQKAFCVLSLAEHRSIIRDSACFAVSTILDRKLYRRKHSKRKVSDLKCRTHSRGISESPRKSIRQASVQLNIPPTTVHTVLHKRLRLRAYNLQLHQMITPNDKLERKRFAETMLDKVDDDDISNSSLFLR